MVTQDVGARAAPGKEAGQARVADAPYSVVVDGALGHHPEGDLLHQAVLLVGRIPRRQQAHVLQLTGRHRARLVADPEIADGRMEGRRIHEMADRGLSVIIVISWVISWKITCWGC